MTDGLTESAGNELTHFCEQLDATRYFTVDLVSHKISQRLTKSLTATLVAQYHMRSCLLSCTQSRTTPSWTTTATIAL